MNDVMANIEAEVAVLSAFFNAKKATEDILSDVSSMLKSDDFYRPEHSITYAAIQALRASGAPIDLLTVSDYLTKQPFQNSNEFERIGGLPYLTQLANKEPTAARAMYHAKIVKEKSIRRKLDEVGADIRAYAMDESDSVENAIVSAQQALLQATDIATDDADTEEIGAYVEEYCTDLYNRNTGVFHGVATGFRSIDNHVRGLYNGDFTVLAARTRVGKSGFAWGLTLNIAKKGKRVVYFSLEMSKNQLMDRLTALEAGIPLDLIEHIKGDEAWNRVYKAADRVPKWHIHLCDKTSMTVSEMRRKAQRIKQRYGGLDLIVVDHIHLVKGEGHNIGSRVDELYDIARDLKGLAKSLDVPVFALAQVNRSTEGREDKTPRISDIRASGGIEENADNVWILHREDPRNPLDTDAKVILDKLRQGKPGTVQLKWFGQFTKFADISNRTDNLDKRQKPEQPTLSHASYSGTHLADTLGEHQ